MVVSYLCRYRERGRQPTAVVRGELTMMYNEMANPILYHADFNDITKGDSRCKFGWDLCTGIGSPRTYAGK